MKSEDKIRIYDRLLDISLEIPTGIVPDPAFINRKLGECHIYMGEVEKFFIKVSKEISVMQQAFNNSQANYEMERENLLTTREDIKALPNITEKTAKANSFLKELLKEIHEYENELVDLNNLLKAINHKHKNLSRTNSDIKAMMKMVEAQIRIGNMPSDSVARDFMEEMRKGLDGEDEFENATSDMEETEVADPTVPLNVDELMGDSDEQETLSDDLVKEAETSLEEDQPTVDLEAVLEPMAPQPKPEPEPTPVPEPTPELEPKPEPEGGETAKDEGKAQAESEKTNAKNPDDNNTKKVDGQVDLDELLKQYA